MTCLWTLIVLTVSKRRTYKFLANKLAGRLVKAQDLGQADGEEHAEEEIDGEVAQRATLVRTQTQVSTVGQSGSRQSGDAINYNLIKCTFIVLKEQGHLWRWFLVLLVATLAGGKFYSQLPACSSTNSYTGATYPAQAILFSRIVEAFQLAPAEAVKQGDFYSLMFFIVAIGNLLVFASVGWVCLSRDLASRH